MQSLCKQYCVYSCIIFRYRSNMAQFLLPIVVTTVPLKNSEPAKLQRSYPASKYPSSIALEISSNKWFISASEMLYFSFICCCTLSKW